jgi:hypothetical protein
MQGECNTDVLGYFVSQRCKILYCDVGKKKEKARDSFRSRIESLDSSDSSA